MQNRHGGRYAGNLETTRTRILGFPNRACNIKNCTHCGGHFEPIKNWQQVCPKYWAYSEVLSVASRFNRDVTR